MGKQVGLKIIDLIVLREKNYKREIKLLNILLFIRSTVWKVKIKHPLCNLSANYDKNYPYKDGNEYHKNAFKISN